MDFVGSYYIGTGWGKISSLISVGHCEGRGGRRRVGLGSKGAGSWDVPVTTLRSRKDGVVQRAARVCRRNLLFAKSLYLSVQRAFRTRYQITPRDRVPDRKSILLWVENFRETGSVSEERWGRPRTSRTPENIEAVRLSVLQSPRRSARKHHANNGHHLQDSLSKTTWCKTSNVVVSESRSKMFVSRIVFLLFTLKFREVILPHSVYHSTRFKKVKFANAQQTKQIYQYKNLKEKLFKINAAIL